MNLAAIMICLFQYVSRPRRSWTYAIVFALANLLSNYYWGIYVLVMDDYPNVSSILAYVGWNIAYLILPFLQLEMRYDEEKHFFSPVCLLPIPLNIAQFFLYIQYGGLFNNIWQGTLSTVSICLSINSIMYYLKNRKKGAVIPYLPFAAFLMIFMEYVMWTSSCFSWPSEWLYPYNYATLIENVCYILIPLAMIKTYSDLGEKADKAS